MIGMFFDTTFDFPYALQRLIPPAFQLISHQSIFRIRRVVLSLRTLCAITRSFQVTLERFKDFILFVGFFFAGQNSRLHGCGLHDTEYLLRHCVVGRHSSECDAPRCSIIHPSPITSIADDIMMIASVLDHEFATTTPATQQTSQQCRSGLNRTRLTRTAVVLLNHRTYLFKLFPTHVTFMIIRNQGKPLGPRLFPMTVARLAVGVVHRCFSSSVHVSPAVCRMRKDRKSTRLNSSHVAISYAVFCLKKKN